MIGCRPPLPVPPARRTRAAPTGFACDDCGWQACLTERLCVRHLDAAIALAMVIPAPAPPAVFIGVDFGSRPSIGVRTYWQDTPDGPRLVQQVLVAPVTDRVVRL